MLRFESFFWFFVYATEATVPHCWGMLTIVLRRLQPTTDYLGAISRQKNGVAFAEIRGMVGTKARGPSCTSKSPTSGGSQKSCILYARRFHGLVVSTGEIL
jgi:hypothetical protein